MLVPLVTPHIIEEPDNMDLTSIVTRWGRPLALIAAIMFLAWVRTSIPEDSATIAPPSALQPTTAAAIAPTVEVPHVPERPAAPTAARTISSHIVLPAQPMPEDVHEPVGLQAEFKPEPAVPNPAPTSRPKAELVPIEGHTPVVADTWFALYTSPGAYTPKQVRALVPDFNAALDYVSLRTDMQLREPVTIIFDRHPNA